MPLPALDLFHIDVLRLHDCASADHLHAAVTRLSESLGYPYFVYALREAGRFAQSPVHMLDGYPPGWVARYAHQDFYGADPVLRQCLRTTRPVPWHRLVPFDGDEAANAVMAQARAHGLASGVSVSLHTGDGEVGVFSLAGPADDAAARVQAEDAAPYAQVMAGHLHDALRRVSVPKETVDLSERERQCLRWAADGKTSWEIGTLLDISERTVNFHLNGVMEKLGVFNRQHAIARAVLLGLITPAPFV